MMQFIQQPIVAGLLYLLAALLFGRWNLWIKND